MHAGARSRWPPVAFAVVGVVALALATLALYGTHSPRFQHHTARQLASLVTADALRVDIRTASDATFAASALVFPVNGDVREASDGLLLDGRVVYELAGLAYNVTLVGGRGFLTIENATTREVLQNRCLADHDVPPFHLLPLALHAARVIEDAPAHGLSSRHCSSHDPSSQLVEFTFAGETFVVCSYADGHIDAVHGDDLRLTFSRATSEEAAMRSQVLTRPGGLPIDECALIGTENSSATKPTARAARALSHVVSRTQDAVRVVFHVPRAAPSGSCATTCKDGKKVCLLVHGLGQRASDELLVDSYFRTWGDAPSKLRCCSEAKLVRLDTIHNAWHSDALATQFCEAAIALTPHSRDPMALENLAVLSHSMGNLIVASAAMKQRCAVGPTSKWIALAGPIRGSYGANLGVHVCDGDDDDGDVSVGKSVLDGALVKTLTAVDMCPARNATRSLVFQGSDLSNEQLDALYEQAVATYGKLVSASMCGTSATGLPTIFSTWYSALGELANHTSLSDGAVEIDSCRGPFPESQYTTSWRGGRFYQAKLNHADVTMRNGDGLWAENRQPVKWINCQF